MSFMTSGVKIRLCPRTCSLSLMLRSQRRQSRRVRYLCAPSSLRTSEHQLSLGGLEVVVVVELLAAHELLQLRRRPETVDAEFALDELGVGVRPFAGHAVDAERPDLPSDVDRPVVHRVAEAVADVAAEDHAAALHHEARHRPGVAADDDRAALLVDPRTRADAALDEEVASAEGGARERAGVRVDDDDARHHVLAGRPADAAGDVDLGPVDQAAAEVAEAPFVGDAAPGENADADRVLRARVAHGDVLDALFVEKAPQLEVDLPRRQVVRVEARPGAVDLGNARRLGIRLRQAARVIRDPPLASYRCHTITSPSNGSYVSISRSRTARIAISSDASATMSSPSYSTSGFAAISSFATPSASSVTAMYVKTPSSSSRLSFIASSRLVPSLIFSAR